MYDQRAQYNTNTPDPGDIDFTNLIGTSLLTTNCSFFSVRGPREEKFLNFTSIFTTFTKIYFFFLGGGVVRIINFTIYIPLSLQIIYTTNLVKKCYFSKKITILNITSFSTCKRTWSFISSYLNVPSYKEALSIIGSSYSVELKACNALKSK